MEEGAKFRLPVIYANGQMNCYSKITNMRHGRISVAVHKSNQAAKIRNTI